jgi:hypothetical protein
MAVTTYKGAYLPTVSGDAGVWGTLLNTTTFPVFDANLGGIVTKSLSNVNVSLSATESQACILRLTGALSGNVQITTACQGFTIVENLTTNAFTVTFTNGVGTPVTIFQGGRTVVITDSTNGPRIASREYLQSTTSIQGIIQLATSAEVQTGTDANKAVTPATLQACTATTTRLGVVSLATAAETITGSDNTKAITPADLLATLPATAYAEYNSYSSFTSVIPYDNTIPQNTEGTQLLTASITPKKTTNRVRILFQATFFGDGSGGALSTNKQRAIAALFQDSIANALKAQAITVNEEAGSNNDIENGMYNDIMMVFEHSPNTTSAVTYKIRVGPDAGTIYINGDNGSLAGAVFGGVFTATLSVQEILT